MVVFCEISKVLTLVTLVCLVWGQEECITPESTDGNCIPLNECDFVKAFLMSGSDDDAEYVNEWLCGFNGLESKVCCPFQRRYSRTTTTTSTTATTISPTTTSMAPTTIRPTTTSMAPTTIRTTTTSMAPTTITTTTTSMAPTTIRTTTTSTAPTTIRTTTTSTAPITIRTTTTSTAPTIIRPTTTSMAPTTIRTPTTSTAPTTIRTTTTSTAPITIRTTTTSTAPTIIRPTTTSMAPTTIRTPTTSTAPTTIRTTTTSTAPITIRPTTTSMAPTTIRTTTTSITPNTTTTPATTTTTTTSATTTTTAAPLAGSCITFENTLGTCVGISQCPSIKNKLIKTSPENLKYVLGSRCNGTEQLSVCCETTSHTNSSTNSECKLISGIPDPDSKCCGFESENGNKIFNGEMTSIHQYPWLALIEYTKSFQCGGALITSQHVLTAAHCIVTQTNFDRTAKSVRLGDYNITNAGRDCIEVEAGQDCTDGPISILITSKHVHPDYKGNENIAGANDIALLKLQERAPYTEFIRPICLPSSDMTLSPPLDLRFYVAGWGAVNQNISKSDIKLHTDIPYVEKQNCRELYREGNTSLLEDTQICAGGNSKDTCNGDSGGPLMYVNNKRFEVTGVISFGLAQCGVDGWPSIYTNVYKYLPWIKSFINKID